MYRPFVGARLPKHHFKADTNDMVRLGTFRKRTAEDQSKIALIVMELMFGNSPRPRNDPRVAGPSSLLLEHQRGTVDSFPF